MYVTLLKSQFTVQQIVSPDLLSTGSIVSIIQIRILIARYIVTGLSVFKTELSRKIVLVC